MKLKDAYERWGQQNANYALYIKTRSVFAQAWSKLNWDSPCKELTLPVLTQALANKKIVVAESKIRAASVMVHVLTWAHEQEPNETPKPLFEYCDLLNATKQKEENIAIKELKQKKSSLEQKEPNMEQEKDRLGRSRNRAPRAVAQIDPKTLQVIKIWPKMTAAEKILGIFAIDRAIKKCRPAGGFYWCNEQDVTTFQPAEDRRGRTVKKATIKQKKTPTLSNFPDKTLIDELRDRGWRGKITLNIEVIL